MSKRTLLISLLTQSLGFVEMMLSARNVLYRLVVTGSLLIQTCSKFKAVIHNKLLNCSRFLHDKTLSYITMSDVLISFWAALFGFYSRLICAVESIVGLYLLGCIFIDMGVFKPHMLKYAKKHGSFSDSIDREMHKSVSFSVSSQPFNLLWHNIVLQGNLTN